MLEDVHWADQATLDVLRVLGRRIDSTQALVLATYRDDEVGSGHPLRVVLGELASAPAVTRLSVPRLSLDAVRELAEPSGADAEAIHRLTDGNAFYVTEVLAAGSEHAAGLGSRRGARADGAPRARGTPAARGRIRRSRPDRARSAGGDRAGRPRGCSTRASSRACCARTPTGSPSGTSSPASPSRAPFRPTGAARSMRPSCAPSRAPISSRGSPITPRRPGDSAAVLEYAPEAARRAAAASAHREAAAQYARALRHADALAAVPSGPRCWPHTARRRR